MNAPVAPGDVLLGKYRVERVLGQGGMGVVVAARHQELGELFAIKFLLPHAMSHPQAIERFVLEARASAKLKGEHVAKVHDVGRLASGLPYMILEHLTGKDLKDVLHERGPLPVGEAVTYLLQACEAIAEAHGCGIVHRDIKPANLFLTRRANGSPCVKVLDFGISKQLEPESADQHSLTKTGMLLGTPYYMSPEQMLHTKEVDARSDIWSLGCVLHELLTGKVPFSAAALTELVGKILQEEPARLSVHRGDVPPAVEAAMMGCLVKRKEQRIQTVEALAQTLRAALVQPALAPIPAPRASIPSHPVHEATLALTGSGAAMPAPAPIAITAPGWGTTSPEARRPAPPKSRAGLIVGAVVGLAALVGCGAWLTLGHRPPGTAREAARNDSSVAPPEPPAPGASMITVPDPAPSTEPVVVESAMPARSEPEPPARPISSRKLNPAASVAVGHAAPAPTPTVGPTAAPATSAVSTPKKRGMY
jgi:serine/threonine protein kinase